MEYMYFKHAFEGNNEIWRYIIGVVLVFVGYFVGQVVMLGIIGINVNFDMVLLQEFESSMDFSVVGLSNNAGLILLLLMFIFATLALYFVVKYLHYKDFLKLITPKETINYSKILFGFGFWLITMLVLEAVSYSITPENYEFRWHATNFIFLVMISLVLLPVQTSFEELFFRGYLMQGLAFFAKNKWLPILISSVLFGLVHSLNPEVEKYGFWTMQTYYMLAGGFLALITVLDDSLELALGVHWATNFGGAALLNYEGGVLKTDSLFLTTDINPMMMTLTFLISAIVFIFICYKKYNWPSLKTVFENKNQDLTV